MKRLATYFRRARKRNEPAAAAGVFTFTALTCVRGCLPVTTSCAVVTAMVFHLVLSLSLCFAFQQNRLIVYF
jgi:hypothetical protein